MIRPIYYRAELTRADLTQADLTQGRVIPHSYKMMSQYIIVTLISMDDDNMTSLYKKNLRYYITL